jgi:hypothetical protein
MQFMVESTHELLDAAGAQHGWASRWENSRSAPISSVPAVPAGWAATRAAQHGRSAPSRARRPHFVCDGSSMVTSSRGQPATIQALAFRAAEHIAGLARQRSDLAIDPARRQTESRKHRCSRLSLTRGICRSAISPSAASRSAASRHPDAPRSSGAGLARSLESGRRGFRSGTPPRSGRIRRRAEARSCG